MNYTIFTVEEENLLCAFDTSSRAALTAGVRDALPGLSGEGAEMLEIANSALSKLETMSDDEFSKIAFSPAYGDEEGSDNQYYYDD